MREIIQEKLSKRSMEDFKIELEGKKLILFGASSCAKKFLSEYEDIYKVEIIIDNDEKKWGNLYENRYVINGVEELKKYSNSQIVILITSTYAVEIGEQLTNMGYDNYFSYLHMVNLDYSSLKIKESDLRNINSLKKLLEDEKSKKIVDTIIEKRELGITDYQDICIENQYFLDEIFTESNQEVYIDAGTYDGATLLEFMEWVNHKYKRIYAFEMDRINYENMKCSYEQKDVMIYNAGVWNKNQIVQYTPGESSSRISDNGKESVECVALDSLIKEEVTFIKMDIEGAELEALEGCKNIIKRDKPKLAICLYHKAEHLWEIPFYIHQLVPEYKFYIRHHSTDFCETVLYATL